MRPPKKKNDLLEDWHEKAVSWFWVILFISAIFFLRSLLVEMHTETVRISEERKQLEMGMEQERERSRKLYQEFYAELNEMIQGAIKSINKGEMPNNLYFPAR